MTLPDERYRAVSQARVLLEELASGRIPRVPKIVRQRAYGVLRHFPSDWDLDRNMEGAQIFAKHLDPLYKMVKRHEMADSIEEELTEKVNTK